MEYSRLDASIQLREGLPVSDSYLIAVLGALLLPSIWSAGFSLMVLRLGEPARAATWPVYVARIRMLNLLAVPAWWAIADALFESVPAKSWLSAWPQTVILILPLSVGVTTARLLTALMGRRIDELHWTTGDLLNFALWSTLASTFPLLVFASGIDALDEWRFSGFLLGLFWITAAGFIARFSIVGLRFAAGFKPRLVKSGELYKRAFALAERMGVPLLGVFVVPAGPGRSINAHAGPGFVGMTDTCVHRLRGALLDFVIAHELVHSQRRDGRNHLRIAAAVYCSMGALTLTLTRLHGIWQAPVKYCVILIPMLVFYFLSQQCELAADRAAVEFTGEPETAIKSLAALNYWSGGPEEREDLSEFFASHPSFSRRIDAIARMGEVPVERVNKILEQFRDEADGAQSASQ
jgi:Zn-dependent protease with chaperone function